jgi:ATP-dependent Lon protease
MKKDMTEIEFVDQTKQDYKELKGFEDKTQHEPKSLKKAVDAISLDQLKSQTKDDPLNVKRESHFLKDEWVAMKAELAVLEKDIKDTEAVPKTMQDLDAHKERPYKITTEHKFLPHLHPPSPGACWIWTFLRKRPRMMQARLTRQTGTHVPVTNNGPELGARNSFLTRFYRSAHNLI